MYSSAFVDQVGERFLRAELLRKVGRTEEALRWYEAVGLGGKYAISELPYLGPCHLARAEIHAFRGETKKAIEHYRQFVELWSNSDPELHPAVTNAIRQLKLLRDSQGDRSNTTR